MGILLNLKYTTIRASEHWCRNPS